MAHLTQRAIRESFMELLNEKPLEKITVKDIVEDCGINRNTFYYHYQDIYELLEDVIEEETKKITGNEDEDDIEHTWMESTIKATEYAMKSKKAIFNIYNSINREVAERYMNDVAEHFIRKYVKSQVKDLKVDEYDEELIIIFYKHAVVGMIIEWIQKGMKDDPESYIHRFSEIFDGSVRDTLEKVSKK